MANVYFKKGQQSALDNLNSYVAGSFYLTEDTNRLYFAQTDNNLVPLNQFIHFVSTRADLPSSTSVTLKDGDIYYIQTENILCIYQANKSTPWVQINPDTKLSPTNSAINVETSNGATGVQFSVHDEKLGASSNYATGLFTLVGGDGIDISSSGNAITIEATTENTNTTYDIETTLQTTKGQIKLHNTSNTSDADSTIDIQGAGSVNVSSTADGVITITGGSEITGIANGFDTDGSYVISLSRNGQSPLPTTAITPTIAYGHTSDGNGGYINSATPAVFASGTASLDVYTASEVDALISNRLSSADALTYRGAINSTNAEAKLVSNPADGLGTTYKAEADFTYNGISAKTGDLIIAGGTSDNNVTWEVIPSGNDQLISISGSSAEKAVVFHDGVSNTDIGAFGISGGRKNSSNSNAEIEVTATTSNSGKTTAFSVVHGAPGSGTALDFTQDTGVDQVTGTDLVVPIIHSISVDAQGHISEIHGKNYTLTDTHGVLTTIGKNVQAENNTARTAFTFGLDSQTQTTNVTITSSSLAVGADSANGTMSVDLVWGSFT